MKPRVICMPGGVAPAAQRYAPLIRALGDAADLYTKDLEVYREAQPPADYSIDWELEAIDRLADSKNLERFHLVGYSGGGFISLAYAGTRPHRLASLSLFEPAAIPGDPTEAERNAQGEFEAKLSGLTGQEFMATFVREQLKPGVAPPPPPSGPPSPEMQKRPAGIATLQKAFRTFRFDRETLRSAPYPVFYGYGDLSHEEQALKAGVLAQLLPEIRVRRFAGVHHFVPPEQIYSADHVEALLDLWRREAAIA